MAKTGDVMFTADAVEYNYMLAVDENGRKRWQVRQLYTQSPSIVKSKIDMVIVAAPHMRQASDGTVIETRTIATVLGELRTLVDEVDPEEIVLDGLDVQTYNILFDKTATDVRSVVDETGRIVEYEITLSCWDLYQPA